MEGRSSERIIIEHVYGSPGQIGWAYEAVNMSNGSVIVEGEVEREGKTYRLLLRPTDGGREELEDVDDPRLADSLLIEILQTRALQLLDSSFR